MEEIVIYSLNGCGYSKAAVETLNKYNIKYKIYNVDWSNKDDYKRMNNMTTFPQIFYKKNGSKIKIGGNNDLDYIINLINETKESKKFDEMVISLNKKLNIDKSMSLKLINFLI